LRRCTMRDTAGIWRGFHSWFLRQILQDWIQVQVSVAGYHVFTCVVNKIL